MSANMDRVLLIGLLVSLTWTAGIQADDTLIERRSRIEKMDPQAKQELLLRQQRFIALQPEEQERLRRLHNEIQNDPNADELRRVMARYYDWLKTLTLYQQAELRQLPAAERIRRIAELRAKEASRESGRAGWRGFSPWGERFSMFAGQITHDDREVFLRWIRQYADQHGRELLEKLPPSPRQQLQTELQGALDPDRRRELLFWRIWLRWHLDNPGKMSFLTDEDLDRLMPQLSAETQRQFDRLSQSEKRQRLLRSIRMLALNHYASRRSETAPSVVSRQELVDFFTKSMDPKQRDYLSQLPPRDMERRLLLYYLNSRLPEPLRFPIGGGHPRRAGPGRMGPGPPGRMPHGGFVPPGATGEGRPSGSVSPPGEKP